MKKQWLSLAVAAAFTGNVYAADTQTVTVLPEASVITKTQSVEALNVIDMQAAFQQDAQPMQLAALSGQEMKETEGAWVNFAIGGGIGGLGYVGGWALGNYSWNTGNFLGNVGTGALIGGTFGAAGIAAGGGLTLGANIWRFNSFALNSGVNTIWRQ